MKQRYIMLISVAIVALFIMMAFSDSVIVIKIIICKIVLIAAIM